ncbi:hypothetical protein [Demequina litorisediminis]|uniref:Uncharacterized protein n=1 Tax=Demequina litorisediminis TaxID=1849022 RepID=A0ABQ6IIT9_9MICO|nr:hypothetical protein [Demequina litorisediminis]GMA37838.1 hypothetical protein GCM10025876_40420 [Demequina litorisediminis]
MNDDLHQQAGDPDLRATGAPQLEYYAAARNGSTAILETATRDVVAWVVHDRDKRARSRGWVSPPEDTIPSLIVHVARHRGSR